MPSSGWMILIDYGFFMTFCHTLVYYLQIVLGQAPALLANIRLGWKFQTSLLRQGTNYSPKILNGWLKSQLLGEIF
jgi:hypothetical protein